MNRSFNFLASLTLLLTVALSAAAQDSLNYQIVSRQFVNWANPNWGSNPADVVVVGDYAYLSLQGRGLWVMDVSDPANPTTVWFDDEHYRGATKVIEHAGYLYLNNEYAGICVFDLANPAEPREVSRFLPGEETIYEFTIDGETMLARSNDNHGLFICSLADPSRPTVVVKYDSTGSIWATSGAYIYQTAYRQNGPHQSLSGIRIIDISNPTYPVRREFYDTQSSINYMKCQNSYLYTVDCRNIFQVYSLEDPEHPREILRTHTIGSTFDFEVAGEFIIARDGDLIVEVYRTQLDATPPTVELIGTFQSEHPINNFATAEGRIFLAGDRRLEIINYDDPADLVQIGIYNDEREAVRIEVFGRTGYLYDNIAIHLLDLNNPANPIELGSVPVKQPLVNYEIDDVHNAIYMLSGEWGNRRLDKVDVADPTNPVIVDSLIFKYDVNGENPPLWHPQNVAIDPSRGLVFLSSSYPVGFTVYQDDGERFNLINVFQYGRNGEWGEPRQIAIDGPRGLMAMSGTDSLRLWDVSNPTQIRFISAAAVNFIDAWAGFQKVRMNDKFVYMGATKNGNLFDISDLANPELVISGLPAGNVSFYDEYLMTSGWGSMAVYDLTNPHDIHRLDLPMTYGFTHDAVMRSEGLYIADATSFVIAQHPLGVSSSLHLTPYTLHLAPPYPNPFNSTTTISFSLPSASASLLVFDPLGRRVAELIPSRVMGAGEYRLVWDASGVAAGNYFVKLQGGGEQLSRRVTLVK